MIGAFSCNYKKDIETCTNTVELPIPHIWGDEQVAGTATFVDDMPRFRDELSLVLITSTRAQGKIKLCNFDKAMLIPGVIGHISALDYPR